MLVNMLGIEELDEVVDINDRRVEAAADPKARVTFTTLIGAVLSSFISTGSPTAPVVVATTSPIVGNGFVRKPGKSWQVSNRDAA